MNILHLTTLGDFSLLNGRSMPGDFGGGIAASLRDVSTCMKQKYDSHTIISCCYDSEFIPWAKKYDIDVHVAPARWIYFLKRPLFVKISVRDIIRLIKTKKIDIIQTMETQVTSPMVTFQVQ